MELDRHVSVARPLLRLHLVLSGIRGAESLAPVLVRPDQKLHLLLLFWQTQFRPLSAAGSVQTDNVFIRIKAAASIFHRPFKNKMRLLFR